MSYILDAYKGVCFTAREPAGTKNIHSDGFDQLDWNSLLPAATISDVAVPSAEQDTKEPSPKEKIPRKERKELKRKARSCAFSARASHFGEFANSHGFNPFLTKKRIIDLHHAITKGRKDDFKLLQNGSVALYKSDIDNVLPDEWLDDNNISFVYETLILNFLKHHDFGFQIQLLFPALVQLILHYPMVSDLHDMLPMKELLKSKLIFLPFNHMDEGDYVDLEDANNGDHWALCVLSILEKKLFVFDSMSFEDEDDSLLLKFASRLQGILFKPSDKIQLVKMKCDQQENFDDCGVYLIMFTCYLVAQILSGSPTSLDISHVKFNPLKGRLGIMELVTRLLANAKKDADNSHV